MNKSFLNNPLFRKILKEELDLVRTVINENYSADKIWSSMSEKDRENALLASADDDGPDLANQYAATIWDNIPADIQDTIDLSVYNLPNDDLIAKDDRIAKDNQIGRTYLRAINTLSNRDPEIKEIVDLFLKANGIESIELLTMSQSTDLMVAIHGRNRGVTKSWNPNNFGNIDPNTQGKLGS